MTGLLIVVAIVAALVFLLIVCNIRIVPQSRAWVMERIGVYSKTWHTGLHIKFPIIERAAKKVDLREQILVCGEGFNHGQYHNHKNGYSYEEGANNYGQAYQNKYKYASTDNAVEKKTHNPTITTSVGVSNTPISAEASMATNADRNKLKINSKVEDQYDYQYGGFDGYRKFKGGSAHGNHVHNRSSQPVITKDNVSMEMDTVVFYQITDPKLFVYGHANPLKAIEHLVATSLRNIVGGLELDETLTSRELINSKIRVVLDEVTDAWGIKITRVELKNIIISDVELAEAMEQQMIAERTKRAQILRAEGESQSKILEAEGLKKHEILIAEGKAEAIRLVNEAKPSQEFLHIRALEAYEEAARGNATKIIVPSNLQSLAGLALSGSEVFKEGEKMGE